MPQKKNKRVILCGVIDTRSIPRGHMDRKSGAGVHKDRRTRRLRTRAASQMRDINNTI